MNFHHTARSRGRQLQRAITAAQAEEVVLTGSCKMLTTQRGDHAGILRKYWNDIAGAKLVVIPETKGDDCYILTQYHE